VLVGGQCGRSGGMFSVMAVTVWKGLGYYMVLVPAVCVRAACDR
jgi:hypothetical protein